MWRHEHKYIYISVAVRTLVLSYIGREGDGQSQDKQAAQITCTCVQSAQWAGAVCILQVMLVPCAFRTCSGAVCSLRSQGVRVIIDFKPIRYLWPRLPVLRNILCGPLLLQTSECSHGLDSWLISLALYLCFFLLLFYLLLIEILFTVGRSLIARLFVNCKSYPLHLSNLLIQWLHSWLAPAPAVLCRPIRV